MTTSDVVRTPSDADRAALRAWFPALSQSTALLENAGGSQVPGVVAEAIATYMTSCYVQLDAEYPQSDMATAVVAGAHAFVERLAGGEGLGRAAIGPSTSQLVTNLAATLAHGIEAGDEIVVSEAGHEANVGPWTRLAERSGATLRWWKVDPETGAQSLDDLAALLSPRTKVVAVVHVSNLLGQVLDLRAVSELVHEASSAHVVADGVAYAPHRAIDVAAWGVDWYVWSAYKVYGPHTAMLWGSHEAWSRCHSEYHLFIDGSEVPYAYEIGGVCHEAMAGLLALAPYLAGLARLAAGGELGDPPARPDMPALLRAADQLSRAEVEAAFGFMHACERPLVQRLLTWLDGVPGVRVLGTTVESQERVGTVAFVHPDHDSAELARVAHRHGVAIRNGHNYAFRLAQALSIDPEPGAVRISLVHYNTADEIERCIAALEPVLGG